MTEATVTEALRGLLAEGLTSGEIIARGYRPGTVYKVQRSLRLAAALASEQPSAPAVVEAVRNEEASLDSEDGLEGDEFEDSESLEDRVNELEAELGRLDQDLAEQGTRLARLESRYSALSVLSGQVAKLQTDARWLREFAADAITLLASQTIEPADEWGWIVPPYSALNRIRRKLMEVNPSGAEALFGDRVGDIMSGMGIFETPPKRRN